MLPVADIIFRVLQGKNMKIFTLFLIIIGMVNSIIAVSKECEQPNLGLNYEKLGYQLKHDGFVVHNSCYPEKAGQKNYLINNAVFGIFQRLEYCVSPEDKTIVTRNLTLKDKLPLFINCAEKITSYDQIARQNNKFAYIYFEPNTLTSANKASNSYYLFIETLKKYNIKHAYPEDYISPECTTCCYSTPAADKDACDQCFKQEKLAERLAKVAAQPTFEHLRTKLVSILNSADTNACADLKCQQEISKLLAFYPEAKDAYDMAHGLKTIEKVEPDEQVVPLKYDEIKDEHLKLLKDFFTEELQGLSDQGKKEFLAQKVKEDPYQIIRIKYQEQLFNQESKIRMANLNLSVELAKTHEQINEQVKAEELAFIKKLPENVLKEFHLQPAPVDTPPTDKVIAEAKLFVKHILAITTKNSEEMNNILNKENRSVCKHSKKEYLLGIRKLMTAHFKEELEVNGLTDDETKLSIQYMQMNRLCD